MNKTLVIMAAGLGSRYGGLKQVDGMGPHGERIMDYSIYDAVRAGFHKVVFIIRKEHEQIFREQVGDAVSQLVPVEYVFQELDRLPDGYTVPEGRVKPWGTGHAVLCCADVVQEPFAVINADDYYGPEAFRLLADWAETVDPTSTEEFCMAGYILKNTLTENGSVSRGVCQTGQDGLLQSVTERTKILRHGDAIEYEEDGVWHAMDENTMVSMNCWCFPPSFLQAAEVRFRTFLDENRETLCKAEYFLPSIVCEMIAQGQCRVRVFPTQEKWFGITYHEDRAAVQKELLARVEKRTVSLSAMVNLRNPEA